MKKDLLKIIAVVLAVIVFIFVKNALSFHTLITPESSPTPTETPDLTIKFDVTKAKLGDKVGAMTIASLNPFISSNIISSDDAVVKFKGRVTLTGELYHSTGGELGDDVFMQNLDPSSLAKMPSMIGDNRSIWFNFTNPNDVKKIFQNGQNNTKNVTITIDNYTIVSFLREVVNSATFVSLIP